ncbi:MAG: ABC transporter ATP-binding protein [Proteiniphilum sp.]|jgi:ABC-type lipoprotein export system ATPase subunit|nr:ABC transporter ATP-binding protein [Proteiniphilum sp.]
MVLIQLRDICKSYPDGKYGRVDVLRGVCTEIESGEFVAVKGPSGSGKTTLLSMLGTLLTPDSGSYHLNGVDMLTPGIDRSPVRNRLTGFVFQDHRLMPQYTVLENILLPTLAYASETGEGDVEYAHALMTATGIARLSQQYPSEISGGEASRAAICRALIMKPLLLLADEPTAQLDRENAYQTTRLLSCLNDVYGTTVVMATHSDRISALAHRTLTLNNGILS